MKTIACKPLVIHRPRLDNQARGQCMIRVTKNLHKKQYSLRQGNKVVGYTTHLTLRTCTFEVNEKTHQRVIRNRQKEVHAFVVGEPVDTV